MKHTRIASQAARVVNPLMDKNSAVSPPVFSKGFPLLLGLLLMTFASVSHAQTNQQSAESNSALRVRRIQLPPRPAKTQAPPLLSTELPQEIRLGANSNLYPQAAVRLGYTNSINLSNGIGGIENYLRLTTARFEQTLADPTLHPNTRKAYEHLLADSRQKLADYQTNNQLLLNLRKARESRNAEEITRAKQELADYLAARLEKRNGRTPSPGRSLEEIANEYKAIAGKIDKKQQRQQTVRFAIVFTILAPLAFVGCYYFYRKKLNPKRSIQT